MQVIAHRGASGDRPEHTLAGYALAIEQGARIIEPDLVPSADGVLYCRHDPGLRRSTDIASRHSLTADADIPVHTLSAAQLDALRCLQPWPGRPQQFNGRYGIPRFEALLDLLEAEGRRRGRPLLVYPEAKHPREFAAAGIDFIGALCTSLTRRGWQGAQAPAWLQCFDHDVLKELHARLRLQCFALVDDAMSIELADLAGWCSGLGVSKRRLFDASGQASDFAREALSRGLALHAWTVRHDQPNPAFADTRAELRALRHIGVSAVFCDFPGRALADLAAD
jgi:glycerophosphoryl diester phosphodiesterase